MAQAGADVRSVNGDALGEPVSLTPPKPDHALAPFPPLTLTYDNFSRPGRGHRRQR